VQDVFDTLTDDQKNVVYFMIGEAVQAAQAGALQQSALAEDEDDEDDEEQNGNKDAGETPPADQQNNTGETIQHSDEEGTETIMANVFDQDKKAPGATLSHSQLATIVEDAKKLGSFKESFLKHAVEYGIENIDILFPDAKAISNTPELIARRQEWVNTVIGGARKTPFSRIKTVSADITLDQARAKGYVKGSLKKEEWFSLAKRITTPTTIYKKQKLDRDDIIDITDLDVVAFLKGEMRLMLDEEIARAISAR
jgi:hypothetical protein